MPRSFRGMFSILYFNWSMYALALFVALACMVVPLIFVLPSWLFILLIAGAGGAIYFLVVSLAVSHVIYDQSPLYKWTWIKNQFKIAPQHIANIHAGFDESSEALHGLFPQAKLAILDFYDPKKMTEPSIARARRYRPAKLESKPIDPGTIPMADGSCDAVFLLFAAHEIRDSRERLRFFREVSRIVAPGGTVLLVEHRRDLANFLAFGPGFLHFYPQTEWLRLATESNLHVVHQYSITPFVGVFAFTKGERSACGTVTNSRGYTQS